MTPRSPGRCTFLPPYLLMRLAEASADAGEPTVADCCRGTLEVDAEIRSRREEHASGSLVDAPAPARAPSPPAPGPGAAAWTVHDAGGTTTLPGTPARSAGEPETGDAAVDEAAYGVAGSLALFSEVYGRDSYDAAGAPVVATVHYGRAYVNAFWDGSQLVFGDGDGKVFGRFTRAVDVLGHEFAHAVTEHTAGLTYQGQSGALNESVSDVFAACLAQRLQDQTVDRADWLIGADLFLEGVQARALRDMRNPGTAYDDPRLGKDPQPAHMDDYVETTDDNGGVHINSGIPNRAFVLAATAIGGRSWEGAGRIWYAALTGGAVAADADFGSFAAATVAAAGEHADVVEQAWAEVGVALGAPAPGGPAGPAEPASTVVRVSRSGGFIGATTSGEVDLESGDPRAPEVRDLVTRVDLHQVGEVLPKPDMFVYRFEVCDQPPVSVPEHLLEGDGRRLADLVLGDDTA